MRKILFGVGSVAGLLAVVLALAGPVSAAKRTMTFTTLDAVGDYVVSWKTGGGCDPGPGTSGASGTVTLTVPQTGVSGQGVPTGPVQSFVLNIDDKCTYTYTTFYRLPDGRICEGSLSGGSLRFLANVCDILTKIHVTVAPYSRAARAASPGPPPVAAVSAIAAKEPDIGAVKNTVFSVTVTPVNAVGVLRGGTNPSANPPIADPADRGKGCSKEVKGTTKVDSAGVNKVSFTVVGSPYTGTQALCSYRIEVALPDGFQPTDGSLGAAKTLGATATPCSIVSNFVNCNDREVNATFLTSVAKRTVFLVQNVTGDSAGGTAMYNYRASCGGVGGVPPALPVNTGSGGVVRTPDRTTVQLREGRFNASLALSPTATDAGVSAYALGAKGEGCEATVAVSGLPSSCTADSATKTAALKSSAAQVILEFMIDCAPPPAPTTTTTEASPPAGTDGDMSADDDMGGGSDGDMGGGSDGDMSGDDDMSADGDDMDGGSGGDAGGGSGPQAMGDTG